MAGVLILGAGGHAKVIADILRCRGAAVLGFLDDDPTKWGGTFCGRPVFGSIDSYAEYGADGLILGVGDIALRTRIVRRLGDPAAPLWCNAVHPCAIVAETVRMGRGVAISAGAVVNPDVVLGDHVIVNTGATVDHDCSIDAFAHIAPGAHLAGGVQVGREVLICIGAAVAPWYRIGDGATVAAGAVVVTNISGHVSVKGIPAREWYRQRDHPAVAIAEAATTIVVGNGH